MDITELINKCIEDSKMIEFTYKKKNGTVGQYVVEPHELRNGYLYAWDQRVMDGAGNPVGGIKQFIIASIVNPLVTPRPFSKRLFKKQEE